MDEDIERSPGVLLIQTLLRVVPVVRPPLVDCCLLDVDGSPGQVAVGVVGVVAIPQLKNYSLSLNGTSWDPRQKRLHDWAPRSRRPGDPSSSPNAEISRQTALEDTDILGIVAKEVRQRQESIEAFRQGDRPDLIAQEEAAMTILNEYLPQQMTREEIIAAAQKVIEEVGAQGPSDKGKVMPKLIAQLKGKADGREINAVVTELLTS